jgi:hypothetical protein
MTLCIPRYPRFADLPRQEQDIFYVPELEMTWKEICNAMKKCWKGYKIAHREADTEKQEYYANIISSIIEGLGYRPIKSGINVDVGADQDFIVFDEDAEDQEYIAEEQEVAEIEEKIQKHRQAAIEFGRKHKKFDWDEITKQHITYITPEEEAEGDMMAMDDSKEEEEELLYETAY